MSTPDETSTEPNSERLVLFTDAVTAIAITLLILPLVDIVPEAAAHGPIGDLIRGHLEQFGAFVLSFAVIFRLWWAHHQIFRHVTTINRALVRWSILWTFAIVVLPLPTAIITAYHHSATTVGLYGGTLVIATGAILMLSLTVHRHPSLSNGTSLATREEVLGAWTAFGLQLLATAVGCVFSDRINFWAFLLLFLSGPIETQVKRVWARRDAGRTREADHGTEELH